MSRHPLTTALPLALLLTLGACKGKADTPASEAGPRNTSEPVKLTVPSKQAEAPSFELDYQKYTLDNGLEVILHRDTSDPLVALATIVHVGSNREQPGKTGFAHFFEHMSFNDSENVPRGSNRKLIGELGGTRNGGTNSDSTTYYEVVPKDAFEKLLWIDSDRLGYMINTVTEWALENEKQVVKNEKRQRVDNVAYGHTRTVIPSLLYPPDHPYHWPVIGSLEDLQAATLADVREFYDQYYGAANATLVIAGDIDIEQTKGLVERWFGEIRRGPEVPPLQVRAAELSETKSVFHPDNFAKRPELSMVFPSVERYHPDAYALDALADVLARGKRAPLYQVLVEEQQLAPEVSAYNSARELAGSFNLRVRAKAGVDLDAVQAGIEAALARFEQQGVPAADLAQIKARQETQFYARIDSVLGKAFMLGNYNEFAGDPGYAKVELERIAALKAEDLIRVYETYIKGKPHVRTSFVPKGQEQLALEGATPAAVVEEKIVQGAEQAVSADPDFNYDKTPTQHDRSEPPLGPPPKQSFPTPWSESSANGLRVLGLEQRELPTFRLRLRVEGGHTLDPAGKGGAASLMAALLMEGTAKRAPAELQDAFENLGAGFNIYADDEGIAFEIGGLSRDFEALGALLAELVLEPRWDAAEFERLRTAQLERLRQREGNPRALAADVFDRLLYGETHPRATPVDGTLASVAALDIESLRELWTHALSPSNASLMVVGDVSRDRVLAIAAPLRERWQNPAFELPSAPPPPPREPGAARIFFVDVPGSKQSVLRIGRLALTGSDPDYNELAYANDILGAGSKSRLFQLLRIEKGYTYGARADIVRRRELSPFEISTNVRANVTLESLQLIREQLEGYAQSYGQAELDLTKTLLGKQNARAFETLGAQLGVLDTIARLDLPLDYLTREQAELDALELERVHALIAKYMDPAEMIYVVVGDGATQFERVAKLGKVERIEP